MSWANPPNLLWDSPPRNRHRHLRLRSYVWPSSKTVFEMENFSGMGSHGSKMTQKNLPQKTGFMYEYICIWFFKNKRWTSDHAGFFELSTSSICQDFQVATSHHDRQDSLIHHSYVCMFVYLYIFLEREREREFYTVYFGLNLYASLNHFRVGFK